MVYLQIDVGISLDQGRANIAVAFLAGDRQGRAAIFVQRVHVWFPFQQLRDHMDGVATRRHQQGRPTILFGVDRRSIVCETDARGRGRVGGGEGWERFPSTNHSRNVDVGAGLQQHVDDVCVALPTGPDQS